MNFFGGDPFGFEVALLADANSVRINIHAVRFGTKKFENFLEHPVTGIDHGHRLSLKASSGKVFDGFSFFPLDPGGLNRFMNQVSARFGRNGLRGIPNERINGIVFFFKSRLKQTVGAMPILEVMSSSEIPAQFGMFPFD